MTAVSVQYEAVLCHLKVEMQTCVLGVLLDGTAVKRKHPMTLKADGIVPMRAAHQFKQRAVAVRQHDTADSTVDDKAVEIAVYRGENDRRLVLTQRCKNVFDGHRDTRQTQNVDDPPAGSSHPETLEAIQEHASLLLSAFVLLILVSHLMITCRTMPAAMLMPRSQATTVSVLR